jgi:xylose isomerase
MRTYMILKDKAARWNADKEIQSLLKQINRDDPESGKLTKKFSPQNAKKLLEFPLDRVSLANEPLPYEKLDQLTMEVLMGVR